MAKPPSLRDIAQRTGVSIMTVSRALRGSPQVSVEKRREILRVARQLDYQPDPQVSRLMALMRTSRAHRPETVFAVINTRPERGFHLREPHVRALYEGAAERAGTLGYRLDEFWLADPELPARRQQSILLARGIEALLLLPFEQPQGPLPIDLSRFAVTAIGRSHASIPCDRATPNHFAAVRLALVHLGKLGFRRLGLALFDGVNERTDRRYSAAFHDRWHQLPETDRVPLYESQNWVPDKFREWFDAHRPEVVISHGEHIRRFIARDLGLLAPRDYGYVNLNRLEPSDTAAGIDQNYRLVGAAALDLLAAQFNHRDRGLPDFPRTVTISGRWCDGDSLPERSPASRRRRRGR